MFPAPQIDVFCGKIYYSELKTVRDLFSRNGYRMLDLRPGSVPSQAAYWIVAVRVRDSTSALVHEVSSLSRLDAHLEETAEMPNYRSLSPLAELSEEEDPNDHVDPGSREMSGSESERE